MKKSNTVMSALALAAIAGSPVQARSNNTVFNLIEDNPDHNLFIEAASAVGMDELLTDESGFTLFLPTDEALEEAGIDLKLGEPLSPEETEQLAEMLNNHIVPDEVTRAAIEEPVTIDSLNGAPVSIVPTQHVTTVNSARILRSDLIAGNGVVHVIDSVLH